VFTGRDSCWRKPAIVAVEGYNAVSAQTRAIPPMGAAESLSRLRGKGMRAAMRAQRAPLPLILQGFRIEAPEGWPPHATRVPLLTLRRVARSVGRGVERAPAPTWPEGAKGRQPAPGRATFPRRPANSGEAAPSRRQRICLRSAPACTAADPGPARFARP